VPRVPREAMHRPPEARAWYRLAMKKSTSGLHGDAPLEARVSVLKVGKSY
jgi:hypothetical protein